MSALTLLSSAVQQASGASAATDVSALVSIRGTISIRTDLGQECDCSVVIQTGPSSTGPWRDLVTKRFGFSVPTSSPDFAPPNGNYPFSCGDFDNFMRVKWDSKATSNTATGAANMTLGVTATALAGTA